MYISVADHGLVSEEGSDTFRCWPSLDPDGQKFSASAVVGVVPTPSVVLLFATANSVRRAP